MRINRQDTNGTKPLLGKGELGYDDYSAGGDTGRVYVGTGTENIALAERLEANMMTKAQFNALAEERKANRAGSGFDELGKHFTGVGSAINEGMWSYNTVSNILNMGRYNGSGTSKTDTPIVNINGVKMILNRINNSLNANENAIKFGDAPNIYPYDTVLTAEQIASGVIKHADASNSGLIVNGKFDTDTSGWNGYYGASLSVVDGKMRVSDTDGSIGARIVQAISTVVGKKYIIESYISVGTASSVNLFATNVSDGSGSFTGIITTTDKYMILEFTATATTTYIGANKTTASVAYFDIDNIAVYPADAISRSDLVFLESYSEDISEKNFVYPLGNVQYLGTNTDGLTGIVNGSFTGFETYSSFGNWMTPSSLIGKGYVWSSLTEAQKKAFIANPDNNCYLDGDKVIQVRYRVRVVQGWGDNWEGIDPQKVSTFSKLSYDIDFIRVLAQGKKSTTIDTIYVAGGSQDSVTFWAQGSTTTTTNKTVLTSGMYSTSTLTPNSALAYEGKCYALPIALVHRRNQGMYHPVYNANGTKKAVDENFWYNTTKTFTSISDCFNPAKLLTASGYIGTVSGRPDGLFYDQVHEGDVQDLRNSSKKSADKSRLISREFNKLVAGTYRGKEGEWNTAVSFNVKLTYGNFSADINTRVYYLGGIGITIPSPVGKVVNGTVMVVVKSGPDSGKILVSRNYLQDTGYFALGDNIQLPSSYIRYTDGTIPGALTGQVVDIYVSIESTRTKSNTLLHCDIIGNPTNYPTEWKQSGVFGTPLIVAEDGTSLLPNGTLDTFKLSRKANATPLLCLRSTDAGQNWTSFTPTFNTTTNAITLTDEPASNLVMVYYQTHTSMAVPVVNSAVLEIGDVFTSTYFNLGFGVELTSNLIGKVSNYAGVDSWGTSGLPYNVSKEKNFIKYTNPLNRPLVLPFTTSPAIKVFPYLTRLNGKAYLNLVFKEMKFGSYLAPTVVTDASATYTQNLTYKINIAGCALDGKVIKWTGTTATSTIDWSLYDVSPTGVIYLLSTGIVYANAKLYDGDSWGDDSKFNIVDNVSTTLDDNGQTVLIGQKTVELPYFIGADE